METMPRELFALRLRLLLMIVPLTVMRDVAVSGGIVFDNGVLGREEQLNGL